MVGPRIGEQMVIAGTLIDPDEAFKTGLVDALETGYESTINHALQWCEELLSLPRHSMLGNRAIARAHFKQAFASHGSDHVAAFVDNWFADETQIVMQALVDKLKNKS